MSSPKIFITGATGYVGGDVLYLLSNVHPDWQITCLVRTTAKAAKISASYPEIRLVKGDLGNVDLLKREAKAADVVLHFADSNDVPAANAIAAGLASKQNPGYFIHTSGTGILFYPDVDESTYGIRRDKIWDDVTGIQEINNIPHHALHREVDEAVFAAGKESSNVITAIVCPPLIYGVGRGPDGARSAGLPGLTRAILERGKGFKVGKGESIWSHVHIRDLSNFYLVLVEAAVDGGHKASWATDGYYFADSGEHVWGELATSVTAKAHRLGYLDSPEVDSLSADDANEIFMYGAMMWGTNSRSRASRARKLFNWKPTAPGIDSDEILEELINVEKESLT